MIILKHGLAAAVSSLLPSAECLLYISFSKFVFENLNANQLSNVNFRVFFPLFCFSDMATFQPFIQIVLEEPLDFQGIFFFVFDTYLLKLYCITVAGLSSQGYVVFPSYKIVG